MKTISYYIADSTRYVNVIFSLVQVETADIIKIDIGLQNSLQVWIITNVNRIYWYYPSTTDTFHVTCVIRIFTYFSMYSICNIHGRKYFSY